MIRLTRSMGVHGDGVCNSSEMSRPSASDMAAVSLPPLPTVMNTS
jgi:hypothetical protein